MPNFTNDSSALTRLFSSITTEQQKLDKYTQAKCQFSRDMNTCILEMLYFSHQKRSILENLQMCRDQCDEDFTSDKDLTACKEIKCVNDLAHPAFMDLKTECAALVEASKRELKL